MSDSGRPEPIERVEAYLDGLMSPAERAEFERQAAANPALRAEIDHQRMIDASLRRIFSPPAAPQRLDRVDERADALIQPTNGALPFKMPPAPAVPKKRKPMRMWPIAAAIVLGLGLSWMISSSDSVLRWLNRPSAKDYPVPGPIVGGPPNRDLLEVYNEQVALGFKPEWECREREQFARTFEKRFHVPIAADPPADAAVWGLSYKTALSRSTILLLAKMSQDNIVVFVDRDNIPEPQDPPASSGLHLFKRQIRDLKLYELSHQPESKVLSLFRDLSPSTSRSCPDRHL